MTREERLAEEYRNAFGDYLTPDSFPPRHSLSLAYAVTWLGFLAICAVLAVSGLVGDGDIGRTFLSLASAITSLAIHAIVFFAFWGGDALLRLLRLRGWLPYVVASLVAPLPFVALWNTTPLSPLPWDYWLATFGIAGLGGGYVLSRRRSPKSNAALIVGV